MTRARRTWNKVFSILAIALTLLPFQNCAPSEFAHLQSSAEISPAQNASSGIPATTPPNNNPGNGSGNVPTPVVVAPAPVPAPPVVVAPPPVVEAAPVPVTPAVPKTCDDLLAKIGRENYSDGTKTVQLSVSVSRSPTSFVFRILGIKHDRTENFLPFNFDPVAFGFSMSFSPGNTPLRRNTSTEISLPLDGGNSSWLRSMKATTQQQPDFRISAPYNEAVDKLERGTFYLSCNGTLIGQGYAYLPNSTGINKCKNTQGIVGNGVCYFGGGSCLSSLNAGDEMYLAATSGYTSCFGIKPTLDNECVAEFGANKGYIASCPLINRQEVP